jgi:hypothetical protein
MRQVNTLYAPATSRKRRSAKHDPKPPARNSAGDTDLSLELKWPARRASQEAPKPGKEWFVNIAVNKLDVDTSFTVKIFIGPPPIDPKTWAGAKNLAGTLVVFLPPVINRGSRLERLMSYGEVVLSDAFERAGIRDLSTDNVVSYLTRNLEWRVQKVCTIRFLSSPRYMFVTALVDEQNVPTL